MWIKHNHSLINTNAIERIDLNKKKLVAIFMDGSSETIGEFMTDKEASDIYGSITRALLFEDPDHPGIIVKDTKGVKKNANRKSD